MRTKSLVWRRSSLCVLSVFLTTSSLAGGRYNAREQLIEFDCVEIINNGVPAGPDNSRLAYSLILGLADDSLPVIDVIEIPYEDSCSATLDLATNILTDETRVRDEVYDVRLELDLDKQIFTLQSADFLRIGDSSLWSVSNGVNTVYLGGTIHTLHQSDYPLPQAFTEIYNIAHTVVFETDPAIELSEADSALLQLPDGVTLSSILDDDTIALLESFLNLFGLTLTQFDHYTPDYMEILLLYIGLSGWGFIDGVDFYFISLAFGDGKLTGGLESNAAHGAALNDSNPEDTDWNQRLETMMISVANGEIPTLVTQDILDWREGRLETIAEDNAEYQQQDPIGFEALLANRNRNWIAVIESYLATPEIEFVLAGLAHFAGPDNVLELLEEQGYAVTRYVPGSLAAVNP